MLKKYFTNRARKGFLIFNVLFYFLAKNKIPLDRISCQRNNEGVNPPVYADLILDGQMSAAKCCQHTIVRNGIKSLECGTASQLSQWHFEQ